MGKRQNRRRHGSRDVGGQKKSPSKEKNKQVLTKRKRVTKIKSPGGEEQFVGEGKKKGRDE